ncbi:MAG: ArnT family glycosyltransferase, partial [Acidimicrobiales bacterium]
VDHRTLSLSVTPPYYASIARTPGYPIFLAILRFVGMGSIGWVRLAQFGLVGSTALVLYKIACELGTEVTARVAAVITLTYLPFLWFARMHLTETLSIALISILMLLVVRTLHERPKSALWRFWAIGGLVGYLTLVRPSFMFVLLPVAAVLILGTPLPCMEAGRRLAALGVAFCLVLAPWVVRNYRVAHRFLPGGALSGVSLYVSAQQYAGKISPQFTVADWDKFFADAERVTRLADGRSTGAIPETPQDQLVADEKFRRAAAREIRRVPVTKMLLRLPSRIAYLWSIADSPPPKHYYMWHLLGRIQYALLVGLSAIGFVSLARRRLDRRAVVSILIWPLYITLVHLVFHVEARYSLPTRPAMMLLGAVGAVAVMARLRSRLARRQGGTRAASMKLGGSEDE